MYNILAALLIMTSSANAIEINNNIAGDSEYVYNKSIIFVFYNNTPCESCQKAIKILEDTYKDYYSNNYDFFIANYDQYPPTEYKQTYNLASPLTVVLEKIENGVSVGTYKINNLEVTANDPSTLSLNFRNQVNQFLGEPKPVKY